MPACTPIVTKLFAQLTSPSSSTRLGIAAREVVMNGISASADPKASRINRSGAWANAIAAKNTAETASHQIITLRRSNRSPSAPPNGPRIPATPKVSSNESACIPGECVRLQMVKFNAVYAAAPPVTEMSLPVASRRIFARAWVGYRVMERLLGRGAGWGAAGSARTGCARSRGRLDGARIACRDQHPFHNRGRVTRPHRLGRGHHGVMLVTRARPRGCCSPRSRSRRDRGPRAAPRSRPSAPSTPRRPAHDARHPSWRC